MNRALVLGGGGPVGIGWETAILAGLLDGGVDVRNAGVIVGTSAGSVVGTSIAHGRDARDMMSESATRERPPTNGLPAETTQIAGVFRLWMSFDEMTQENRARVGALALKAQTVSEDRWLEGFCANGWPGWPQTPLLITAVDCEDGSFVAFDAASGVPIERAVAASCAVPGIFPPVTIDGRRYTDGGVCSGTSADLAARCNPDVVLIVAPMGARASGIGALAAAQIASERAQLEAGGASVRVVLLDEAAQAVAVSLMDPEAVAPTATAGLAHGGRLARELRDWWQ